MIITGINFSTGFNMRGSLRTANAPTAITAYIVSNTVANVSFTAPDFTGDTPVTEYTAIAFPGGVRGSLFTSGSGVIPVTGLTDNTNYTFSVTANNTDGPSANSVSSNSIRTDSYPSAPTIVYAELVSISSANIVYTAPAYNGNSVITAYTAVSNVGGITATVSTANSGNITVTGLISNVSYGFTVYAVNQYGRGLASNISNDIYTSGLPSSPTIAYAKAEGPTSANIVYTAPVSSGNSVIQYYTATSTPGNIKATVNTANSGNITIGGLTRGTSYTFTLTAKNSAGNSLPSASSSAITTYNVPNPPTIIGWERISSTAANVRYAAPSFDGGTPIRSYTVTAVPENKTATVYSSGNTGNIMITGLVGAPGYTFSIYATNDVGSSSPSIPTPRLTSPFGQEAFIIPGTYSWIAPEGITSVSVVAIGAGATAGQTYYVGGGGGGLGYKNNIAVTPGQAYTVVVGAPGLKNTTSAAQGHGGNSWFISTVTVFGGGGYCAFTGPTYPGGTTPTVGGIGGSFVGDGGGNGGNGGGSGYQFADLYTGGGGGGGGYSGRGGYGQQGYLTSTVPAANQKPAVSSGGGGGGGAGGTNDINGNGNGGGSGGGGGGVGIYGKGADGDAGASYGYLAGGDGGTGGSGGQKGSNGRGSYIFGDPPNADGANGGDYGGGGTAGDNRNGGTTQAQGGTAGKGAVRIIWGAGRTFPSTNTIDL
jgi:hypothetical protein